MKAIPYSSVIGCLMYAQVCARLDIAFVVGVLGKYLSSLGQSHWKAAKKVLRYLLSTKDLMLTYRRTDTLVIVVPILQATWMIKSPLLVISL